MSQSYVRHKCHLSSISAPFRVLFFIVHEDAAYIVAWDAGRLEMFISSSDTLKMLTT